MKTGTKDNKCTKTKHKNLDLAELALIRMAHRKRLSPNTVAYGPCRKCGSYHVGRMTKHDRKVRLRKLLSGE